MGVSGPCEIFFTRCVDNNPRYGLYSTHLVPVEGALEALERGDGWRTAAEMRCQGLRDRLKGTPGPGWGGGRDAGSQPLAAAQTVWSRCVSHASRETEAEAKDGAVPSGSGENPATAINGPIAGGHAEQAKKHRARNAGEPALRGDYCLCTPILSCTGSRGVRRPGVPRTLELFARVRNGSGTTGGPGACQKSGPRSVGYSSPSPAGGGSPAGAKRRHGGVGPCRRFRSRGKKDPHPGSLHSPTLPLQGRAETGRECVWMKSLRQRDEFTFIARDDIEA